MLCLNCSPQAICDACRRLRQGAGPSTWPHTEEQEEPGSESDEGEDPAQDSLAAAIQMQVNTHHPTPSSYFTC